MSHPILDIAFKRTLVTALIFALQFPFREIWKLWQHDFTEINGFIFFNYPLPVNWYAKDLGTAIAWIFPAWAFYRTTRLNSVLRVLSIVGLVYCGVDLALFFLCYNTWDYTLVYSCLFPAGIAVGLGMYMKIDPFKGLRNWYNYGWETEHYYYLPEDFGEKITKQFSTPSRSVCRKDLVAGVHRTD